jgi:hypothetical protein
VAPPKAGARKVEPSAPLVTRQPFEIAFVGEQGTLQAVLNAIATTKSPFYIVRNVSILNTQPKPPSREPAPGSATEPTPAPAAPAAPAPTPEGAAPAAPPPEAAPAPQTEALKFIVGEEKVEAQLEIEIVEFAEPPQKETKGKKK